MDSMTEARQNRGRWFCAIPMTYSESGGFWDREFGLVCQGFRKLGMDSRFVALGQPSQREDVPLILCTLAQMMDPNWWRQWHLEGVILNAWGLPRYEPIARAIKTAGVKLNLTLDSGGFVHPHVWPRRYLYEKYSTERDRTKWFPAGWALLKTLVATVRARHTRTLQHLEHGDFLTLPSPLAQQRYSRFLMAVRRPDLVRRLRNVPYPATQDMIYSPSIRKQPVIIAVGRWQSHQKGTPVLARVLERVLAEQPGYSARIIGRGEECVRRLMQPLDDGCKSRINIVGPVRHNQLAGHYQESQILLCTSHHESFFIAGGEALCCGCSVVGDVRISSMPYFCSASSGTPSCDLSVNNLRDALHVEIDAWRRGDRDPVQISATWTARLHPERVAEMFLNLA
jgi:glycosyltransferase involved in cell wall biosynthesis